MRDKMTKFIETSVGKIAITEAGDGPVSVLFVHGNSSSKAVFSKQLNSTLAGKYHLVAMDLPGHGDSDNANNPQQDYTISSYAKLVCEVVEKLKLSSVVLVGWSLGGHIVIEAVAQGLDAKAMVISGTPPVGPGFDHMAEAFHMENMGDTSKAEFDEDDINNFANATIGGAGLVTDELRQAVARTDGISRQIMLGASADPSSGSDQKDFVESWNNPIAVLQGADDVFVQSSYLEGLNWNNLWRGNVQFFENTGHAPFWQDAEKYNELLTSFLEDV